MFPEFIIIHPNSNPIWFNSEVQHHLYILSILWGYPSDRKFSMLPSAEQVLQSTITNARLDHEAHLVETSAFSNGSLIFKYNICRTIHCSRILCLLIRSWALVSPLLIKTGLVCWTNGSIGGTMCSPWLDIVSTHSLAAPIYSGCEFRKYNLCTRGLASFGG